MSGRQIEIDVDIHRLIEQNRLSFDESENDILRRILLTVTVEREKEAQKARRARARAGTKRRRGNWSVAIGKERFAAANMGDAYYIYLKRLAELFPGFLEAFGEEQSRNRRFVAQVPEQLYGNATHLARGYACTLVDGWYYDSNLSADQIARRARRAAQLCGLHYGAEVRIADGLREL